MSVFDLFRGFFGIPGRHYDDRRDPFFDTMTHNEDEDEDDEDDGFYYDSFRETGRDPWKFGFSFGLNGIWMKEPPAFGQVLREMEEIFSQMDQWDSQSGHFGVPSITPPEESTQKDNERPSGNSLRDFMLKTPDSDTQGPSRPPHRDSRDSPEFPNSPFKGWTHIFKFDDIWRDGIQGSPQEELKEDKDLDSAVQSSGLHEILSDSGVQKQSEQKSRVQVHFKSVTVTKVVKPDGTVEERRTVTDSDGNVKTEVTHSGGPGVLEGPQTSPTLPGDPHSFFDMSDNDSLFSKFFKGFK